MYRRLLLFVVVATLAPMAPARAGELYVAGRLFVSTVTASSGGNTTFGFSPSGGDSDSSPVWGSALGFEFGLDEPVPSARDWSFPMDWKLRAELEGLGGRDYELRTKGGDPFFSDTVSWTVMQNLWVDIPMASAVTSLFGRVPLLEPMSFYLGGGAGLAINEFKATDNVSTAKDTSFGLAWQGGAGFGYALTDLVTLSVGYRYQDLGQVSSTLKTAAGTNVGKFELDLASHEFTSGLRVRFYSVPIPSFER